MCVLLHKRYWLETCTGLNRSKRKVDNKYRDANHNRYIIGVYTYGNRYRYRQKDVNREIDKQVNIHTVYTCIQIYGKIDKDIDNQTDRQVDKYTYKCEANIDPCVLSSPLVSYIYFLQLLISQLLSSLFPHSYTLIFYNHYEPYLNLPQAFTSFAFPFLLSYLSFKFISYSSLITTDYLLTLLLFSSLSFLSLSPSTLIRIPILPFPHFLHYLSSSSP